MQPESDFFSFPSEVDGFIRELMPTKEVSHLGVSAELCLNEGIDAVTFTSWEATRP